MFYGAQIKPGVTVSPSVEDGGEILHLSQICLVEAKDDSKTLVQLNDGKSTYTIAVLQKDKCEQVSVDLFVSTINGVKISTKGGKNEVHVVGYFEPEGQEETDFDDEDGESDSSLMNQLSDNAKIEDLDEEDEDEDDSADELSAKPAKGKQVKGLKEGNKKPKKKDEDDEVDEDEDEDEEEDDEDEDEDEEEDDEEAPELANGVSHDNKMKGGKKDKKTINTVSQNKQSTASAGQQQKRKNLNENKKAQNDLKKPKVENKKTEGNPAEIENFEKELIKYLTANGRTNLGILGQKVKKPASIDKLGHYIKENPAFKLENGFVSLVK